MFMIISIVFCMTNIDAIGADWKFCGGATLFKGENTIAFYDSESIYYTPSKTVRVWVKIINQSKFESVMKKNQKQIVEKSAKKVVDKYYPPYSLVYQKSTFDDCLDIISWEVCANSYEINTRSLLLFEINCLDKKIRTLSAVAYNKNGEVQSSSKNGDWEYISPESNSEILHKILCK